MALKNCPEGISDKRKPKSNKNNKWRIIVIRIQLLSHSIPSISLEWPKNLWTASDSMVLRCKDRQRQLQFWWMAIQIIPLKVRISMALRPRNLFLKLSRWLGKASSILWSTHLTTSFQTLNSCVSKSNVWTFWKIQIGSLYKSFVLTYRFLRSNWLSHRRYSILPLASPLASNVLVKASSSSALSSSTAMARIIWSLSKIHAIVWVKSSLRQSIPSLDVDYQHSPAHENFCHNDSLALALDNTASSWVLGSFFTAFYT